MGWNDIKIDAADTQFSLAIRVRDKRCVCCGRPGTPNADGLPVIGLQCSHYWGRRAEATRYEPDNCDALCAACHQKWGGDYRDQYKDFKTKQLGKNRYTSLEIQHNSYHRKDRGMSLIVAKAFLKSLL